MRADFSDETYGPLHSEEEIYHIRSGISRVKFTPGDIPGGGRPLSRSRVEAGHPGRRRSELRRPLRYRCGLTNRPDDLSVSDPKFSDSVDCGTALAFDVLYIGNRPSNPLTTNTSGVPPLPSFALVSGF